MTALALACSALATLCLVAASATIVHDRPHLLARGTRLGRLRSPRPQAFPSVGRRRSGRARRRRLVAIDAEIPQLLDLLAAGSSAGLAAPLALRRAVDGLAGPLADEVRATVRSVDLGARWRDELEGLADRLDLPDLRRTVAALTRTETLGASLAEATAELAASVRQARRAATAERARTAPVKMLFPLVFLVLPAFLLLTVVPVLLTTVRSIG
jgi:tight adherence protein C